MPSATGATRLVRSPAGLRAAVRTRRRTAAASPAGVGAAAAAAMGRRQPALGLDPDLEAHYARCGKQIYSLRTPRRTLANGLPAAIPRRRLGCKVLKFSRTG